MNGRKAKARRRAEREHSDRYVAAMRAAVPQLERTTPDGDHEVWQVGPATVLVPVVPTDAPTELQQAITVHRMAALTTDCPRCDNDVRVTLDGQVFTRHKAACPGDPDRLVQLGERLGVEVTRRD
ncbi:hypothetical protein [Streptomyces sp. MH13]|uniref:hypothetical protein n=1 Tax=Streptomyces sp. MH13 TaxID=3417651 RepID=UPI003CF6580A